MVGLLRQVQILGDLLVTSPFQVFPERCRVCWIPAGVSVQRGDMMDVLWFLLIGSVAGGFPVASMKCPSARLARATAGMTQIVAKEIDMRGTFRFHAEFATAVRFLNEGLINGKPVITGILPVARAIEAFDLAADKSQSLKVQIAFADAVA